MALAAGLLVTGCISGASPRVKVLGVEKAAERTTHQSLTVFVEVVNPTHRALELSRLEYRVSARSWFQSTGKVRLSRQIGAGESAVVEINVPVDRADGGHDGGEVPYTLEGRLFAIEDKLERSWKVAVHGEIGRATTASAPIRVTSAGID